MRDSLRQRRSCVLANCRLRGDVWGHRRRLGAGVGAVWWAGLLVLGGAASGCPHHSDSPEPDAAVDARVLPDVTFVDPDPAFDESYVPIAADVTVTTLLQTRRSRYPQDEFLVDRYGRPQIPMDELGQRHPQSGEPHLLRDDLATGDATATAPRSLLYFVHLSDAQLIDTQSPAYVPSNKYTMLGDALPAFHQMGPLAPHLLDAQLQTANQFGLQRPFDFFIHTGDSAEDAQENEVVWFVAVMDGGPVRTDSGDADDPIPGPDNDAWDPFVAGGVAGGVPWYAVVGNHDVNVNGNFPRGLIEEANNEPYYSQLTPLLAELDTTLPGVGTANRAPNVLVPTQMPAFVAHPPTLDIDELWDEVTIEALTAGPVVPDAHRAALDTCGYINVLFDSNTTPPGHGFTPPNLQRCTGNYTTDPVPGLPLRLIVLDSGSQVGGSAGMLTPPLNADGSVNQALAGDPAHDQLAWLVVELDRAAADDVAVMVASHHASSSIASSNGFTEILALFFADEVELDALWRKYFINPAESMSGAELRELLAGYANVFLHLVGHSHANRVNAVCPDGTLIDGPQAMNGERCGAPPAGRTAANGYWEVMAASSRDFPNQFRITEVVDRGDGTGAIYSTVVDAQGGAGSLHEVGLLLATAETQADRVYLEEPLGTLADRNVELRFAWPQALVPVLATAEGATRIESVTTLAEPAPGLPVLPTWQ